MTMAFLLANTPPSLYHALVAIPTVHRMRRECTRAELETYYDHITARAKRTEVVIGLAYAVLVALLTTDQPGNLVDASRLQWGPAIEELVQKSGRSTQSIIFSPAAPMPLVRQQQDSGSGGLIIIGHGTSHHGGGPR
jgi:hypothetical protein